MLFLNKLKFIWHQFRNYAQSPLMCSAQCQNSKIELVYQNVYATCFGTIQFSLLNLFFKEKQFY